ncbi:hypothetical protein N307_10621, partial [Dryobates pubescens]
REIGKRTNRTFTLEFWRANFSLFKKLIRKVPWVPTLMNRGVQEGWTYFKQELLKAQELAVPMCQKMSRQGRRPAWRSKQLLEDLREKKRLCHLWKEGKASRGMFKEVVRLCRNKIREAKAQLELKLATSVKDNKKQFYKYIKKGRLMKAYPSLMSNCGGQVSTDQEKAEILNNFFGSVFTGNPSSHGCHVDGPQGGGQGEKVLCTVSEEKV